MMLHVTMHPNTPISDFIRYGFYLCFYFDFGYIRVSIFMTHTIIVTKVKAYILIEYYIYITLLSK